MSKLFKVHIATQAIRSFKMIILVSREQWLKQTIENHPLFFFQAFTLQAISFCLCYPSKRVLLATFPESSDFHRSKGLELSFLFHAKQGPNNRNKKPFLPPQPHQPLPWLDSQWFIIQGNTPLKKKKMPIHKWSHIHMYRNKDVCLVQVEITKNH